MNKILQFHYTKLQQQQKALERTYNIRILKLTMHLVNRQTYKEHIKLESHIPNVS